MSSHHSYKVSIKELPQTSEVEIKSSISADEFGDAVKHTIKAVSKDVSVPGFRKGSAPEKIVREKIGEANLLAEAAEHAISHAYSHILEAEKIDAIGHPKVSITKIAENNPLEFTITTAVVPTIKNFDYKKIAKTENAKKEETVFVTDADVEKAIEDIKNNYGRINKKDKDTPLELTDELVKTWGEFTDVADFKTKLRGNLLEDKTHKAKEKKRLALVDALTKDLEVVIPEVLINSELKRMTGQMKHDIERMGIKWDDYLKHLKKSDEDMHKEWRPDAEKRVKLDLAIDHIAKKEKISADQAKVELEVTHAKEHHKDVDAENARAYFAHIFQNQAVFEFLEKIK